MNKLQELAFNIHKARKDRERALSDEIRANENVSRCEQIYRDARAAFVLSSNGNNSAAIDVGIQNGRSVVEIHTTKDNEHSVVYYELGKQA